MQYCKNCGQKIEEGKFCTNCGNQVDVPVEMKVENQNVNSNINQNSNVSNLPKDNLGLAGFICGIIGFLCCTYVAIPGIICSILSIRDVKNGKVDAKNKWMGIVGLIFSILGLAVMILNIIGMINGTNTIYNLMSNN